jgi:hypothetical protein
VCECLGVHSASEGAGQLSDLRMCAALMGPDVSDPCF